MRRLFLDVETYSNANLLKTGMYRYVEDPSFEILLLSYAIDDSDVKLVDLVTRDASIQVLIESRLNAEKTLKGKMLEAAIAAIDVKLYDAYNEIKQKPFLLRLPADLRAALLDKKTQKVAHNAAFERVALKAVGVDIPIDQWFCSAIKAAHCGLPLSLGAIGNVLNLSTDKKKEKEGKALIQYFSVAQKRKGRLRNMPWHDLVKWQSYKHYNIMDTISEREIVKILDKYDMLDFEQQLYKLDQQINAMGIRIEKNIIKNAIKIDNQYTYKLKKRAKEITKLDNPNSVSQLKSWLSEATGKTYTKLAKDELPKMIEEVSDTLVKDVLQIRQRLSKSSTKKYVAMLDCVCADGYIRGLFQLNGARTGRWSGRLVQLQNLPRNYIDEIDFARDLVKNYEPEMLELVYDDVSITLSQLLRTVLIASPGKLFSVCDFSAIEARVLAWLAYEQWRLDVFSTHGKIYEASASMMFKIPIEQCVGDIRFKGKVGDLALGYQGGKNALNKMAKLGAGKPFTDIEANSIVRNWRNANTRIVKLWADINTASLEAVKYKRKVVTAYRGVAFDCDDTYMTITLPSGRKLYYYKPRLKVNRFGSPCVACTVGLKNAVLENEMYGGLLVENIVQAISRDLLANSMLILADYGFDIVMHVHDEVVAEVDEHTAKSDYKLMQKIMCANVAWAQGLPINAEGYVAKYYKKD